MQPVGEACGRGGGAEGGEATAAAAEGKQLGRQRIARLLAPVER